MPLVHRLLQWTTRPRHWAHMRLGGFSVATFGSCLARFTADEYVRKYRGRVVASVYHNRSDLFVGKFVTGNWAAPALDEVLACLKSDSGCEDADNKSSNIVLNQYEQGLGKHRLPWVQPLLKLVDTRDIDLIVVDNFVDIGARLAKRRACREDGILLRLSDLHEQCRASWTLTPMLEVEKAVASMRAAVSFFRQKQPGATVVFINFPHTTYHGDERRVTRIEEYERRFAMEDVLVIPCLEVLPEHRTQDRHHFAAQHYERYADIIHAHLSDKKRADVSVRHARIV